MQSDPQQLLRYLFDDLRDDEYIEVLLIGKNQIKVGQHFVPSVAEVYEQAEVVGNSAHVYFGICPRGQKSGKKESVARCRVLWADVDAKDFGDGKPGALASIRQYILPTSFLVDTGNGYQAYWLLDGDYSQEEAEEALIQVRKAVHGDNVCDIGRRFRVPGTWNVKNDPPILAELLRSSPHLQYSLQDVVRAASPELSRDMRRRILTGDATGYKTRSELDWAAVGILRYQLGLSTAAVKIILWEHPIGQKFREHPDPEHYFNLTWNNLEKSKQRQSAFPFVEQENRYFVQTDKGGLRQISTFIFEPTRLLESTDQDVLLGNIYSGGHSWPDTALSKSAFNRTQNLLNELNRAEWQWFGTDRDTRRLLPYLMERLVEIGTPRAKATSVIGRHGEFWLSNEGLMDKHGYINPETAPLIYVHPRREAPRVTYKLLDDEEYSQLAKSIFALLPQINREAVIWAIVGWFAATPLKQTLAQTGVRFPHLNLYGTRGSGKTATLIEVFQPLLGYREPRAYDYDTTNFVFLALLSSTNGVPISFSEFRRSAVGAKGYARLQRFLRRAYDVGYDSRGKADQTTVEYPLIAPLTLDGEDAFSEGAMKERIISVNLSPETIREETKCWKSFQELITLPLCTFAGRYIQHTLIYDDERIKELWQKCYQLVHEAFQTPLPDRVRRNLAVCVCGLTVLHEHLTRFGVDVPEVTASFVRNALKLPLYEVVSELLGRTELLVDEFVADLVNAVALQVPTRPFHYRYDDENNVLWFHLRTASRWWYRTRHREGLEVLDTHAIQSQLRERVMNTRPTLGQYIADNSKSMRIGSATLRMVGVDLDRAQSSGLDTPSELNLTTLIVDMNEWER